MKDITKNEIANIIHVLAYLAKIDNVVDPAEKKTFKIVCERFGIKIPDLKEILKESVSLRKSLNAIHSKEAKNILVNLIISGSFVPSSTQLFALFRPPLSNLLFQYN